MTVRLTPEEIQEAALGTLAEWLEGICQHYVTTTDEGDPHIATDGQYRLRDITDENDDKEHCVRFRAEGIPMNLDVQEDVFVVHVSVRRIDQEPLPGQKPDLRVVS